MLTTVAEIRDHAPKARRLVAIIMVSLVQHRKPLETKSFFFPMLSLDPCWCSLQSRHTGAATVTLVTEQKTQAPVLALPLSGHTI